MKYKRTRILPEHHELGFKLNCLQKWAIFEMSTSWSFSRPKRKDVLTCFVRKFKLYGNKKNDRKNHIKFILWILVRSKYMQEDKGNIKTKLTINRLLHKWLPKTISMDLNKIFFFNKIIQLLVWFFPIYKGISRNRNSKFF